MTTEDYDILSDLLRSYINERPHFNISSIAKEIEIDRSNLQSWLDFKRPLPFKYINPLEVLLKKYGFSMI